MKKLITILFSIVCCTKLFSQEDSTAATGEAPEKNTFTVGATYTNDANYYGQKAVNRTPYVAAVASYRLKSGLYFTGYAYRLLNDSTGPAISAGNLGLGYGFKISKRLTADLNYSHTFYPTSSPLISAANPDNASVGLTHHAWINTSLSADAAISNSTDIFTTVAISKEINLGAIGKSKKAQLLFTPEASVIGGTQHFYETYIKEKTIRDSLLGILLPPFGNGGSTTQTETKTSTNFSLLSYNLKFPIAYYRSRYVVELQYQLSFLSSKAQSDPNKTNSFLTIGFYYQF